MFDFDSGDSGLIGEDDVLIDFPGFLPLDELGFMVWYPVEIHELGNRGYDCHCL